MLPYREISKSLFYNHKWQSNNSVTNLTLIPFLHSLNTLPKEFIQDVENGLFNNTTSPMAVRVTPYILSRINWDYNNNINNLYNDPLIRQFIPLKSLLKPDHPQSTFDSLQEFKDTPMMNSNRSKSDKNELESIGLVHRYPNKVLFLAFSVCPVYCQYCTRSYSIGPAQNRKQKQKQTQKQNQTENQTEKSSGIDNGDTGTGQVMDAMDGHDHDYINISKKSFKPNRQRWEACFDYISKNREIKDVTVSGGDTFILDSKNLDYIGMKLLSMDNIKRLRLATRGLSVMPSKIISDDTWVNTIIKLNNFAYDNGKHFQIHTHFNHSNEISDITFEAMNILMKNKILVRNQSVFLRGVNDNYDTLNNLICNLSDIGILPYYVYMCDMVPGIEHLRTSLKELIDIEKLIRGNHSGFMTPNFIVDLPNGGGKRIINSYETYKNGIAHYKSYVRNDGKQDFYFYDPIKD